MVTVNKIKRVVRSFQVSRPRIPIPKAVYKPTTKNIYELNKQLEMKRIQKKRILDFEKKFQEKLKKEIKPVGRRVYGSGFDKAIIQKEGFVLPPEELHVTKSHKRQREAIKKTKEIRQRMLGYKSFKKPFVPWEYHPGWVTTPGVGKADEGFIKPAKIKGKIPL